MTNNTCEIILACLVAFGSGSTTRRPPSAQVGDPFVHSWGWRDALIQLVDEEEAMLVMIQSLDEGHPSLLQLFQPLVVHPGPKYSHVLVHGGLHDYFIVYGSIRGHESIMCVIYVGQEAIVSAMNVKIMYKSCQSCVRGPLCLKRPSTKLVESLESYVSVIY